MQLTPRMWLFISIAVVVVLGALSAIAIWRAPALNAPATGTPEATVLTYTRAVITGDRALARAQFSASLESRCTVSAFDRMLEASLEPSAVVRVDRQFTFLATNTMQDGRVSVRMRVTNTEVQPPLGVNTWSSEHTFVLSPSASGWQIDSLDWPGICR